MNEHLNDLRLKAGIARFEDDPRLVVINKEGDVIDPLIGLQKFAELIVRECATIIDEIPTTPQGVWSDGYYEGCRDSAKTIQKHFGVSDDIGDK